MMWLCCYCFFFFKQKTAYEMRISDWSSDVCSSDLNRADGVLIPQRAVKLAEDAASVMVLDAKNVATPRPVTLGTMVAGQWAILDGLKTGEDRKSVVSGKSVSVRVDLGGGHIMKKTKNK